MTTPDVQHHFELEFEVPGTPELVWQAIATAEGVTSWMMPAEFESRAGSPLVFHMGPDVSSRGHVTAFEPTRRIAYEEDWATLVGHAGADVTPLVTEFVVEARSGGTCVVRVVTSAFGTGADWENEFWDEMERGWAPLLDNLRLYLTHFPGQHATPLFAQTTLPMITPETAIEAVRRRLGVEVVGDPVAARGVGGQVERRIERHFVVRLDTPVPGLLSFFAHDVEDGSAVQLQGYVFSDGAQDYVEREQPAWQAWLEEAASDVAAAKPA